MYDTGGGYVDKPYVLSPFLLIQWINNMNACKYPKQFKLNNLQLMHAMQICLVVLQYLFHHRIPRTSCAAEVCGP